MKFVNMAGIDRFLRDEEAATAVEYAIMVVLIILVAIVAIGVLGQKANQSFQKFSNSFNP